MFVTVSISALFRSHGISAAARPGLKQAATGSRGVALGRGVADWRGLPRSHGSPAIGRADPGEIDLRRASGHHRFGIRSDIRMPKLRPAWAGQTQKRCPSWKYPY